MRLTSQEKHEIMTLVARAFNKKRNWKLWLFGSRVNDQLKGGDVDLCIIADESPEELLHKQLWLRSEIEETLDLPVDLIMQSTQRPEKLVTRKAIETGVELTR